MPELPEVETVRLQLLHKLKGQTIVSATVHHRKAVNHNELFEINIAGKTIEHIDRIGKLMIFCFKNEPDFFFLAHLKMTGQFLFLDKAGNLGGGGHTLSPTDIHLPNRHTRISFTLKSGDQFFFNDMRLFGYVKIATAAEVALAKSKFGPEPIHETFDVNAFTTRLKKRKTPIKAALLDQSFIAGLGNIYVDEVLFDAAVRPTRRADRVTKKEAAAIAAASGTIMNASIAVGGTTFQHFVDTGGENGNYTDYLKIFGKQNTPCPRCSTTIKKTRVAGRGTHYCPKCQK